MNDDPKVETWAAISEAMDVYRMKFSSREAAIADLGGESGAVMRYERGFPRAGLEQVVDVENILSKLEEATDLSALIRDHVNGFFATTDEQEEDLRRRVADAIFAWIKDFNPACWVILETEEIEGSTNAQNTAPQRT